MIAAFLSILMNVAISADAAPLQEVPGTPEPAMTVRADTPPDDGGVGFMCGQESPLPPDQAAVHQLLDRLERDVQTLQAFTADLVYQTEDALLGRKTTRTGNLLYEVASPQGTKRFAILFDTLITGQRRSEHAKHYVFDGRWMAEIDAEKKQFIKRELVAPGKTFDPLKLGEGPFPLPIGQPKQEVLARFDVSLLERSDAKLLESIDWQTVSGLLLEPKPGTPQAEDFARIELFYDNSTMLPIGINVIEDNGDRKTVRLSAIQRNPTIDEQMRAMLSITDPDPNEWQVSIQHWEGSQQ